MKYPKKHTGNPLSAIDYNYSSPFISLTALLADSDAYSALSEGDILSTIAEGFRYEVAASGASDHHLTTAGGVKLYALPGPDGVYNFRAFNPAAEFGTDDHPVWLKAYSAAVDRPFSSVGPAIYFPQGYYYFDGTLELKHQMRLSGAGSGMNNGVGTYFRFTADTCGIRVHDAWTDTDTKLGSPTTSGGGSVVEGLFCYSNGGTDRFAAGLWMRGRATVRDCGFENFPSHGIYILAFNDGTGASFGQCNMWHVDRVIVRGNGRCGIWVQGNDANGGVGLGVDAQNNTEWGIADFSLLGNTWVGCHADGNGNIASNTYTTGTTVTGSARGGSSVYYDSGSGNKRYQAVPDSMGANSGSDLPHFSIFSSTIPGSDNSIWRYIEDGGDAWYLDEWQSSQANGHYYPGGNFIFYGASQNSTWIGGYAENNQVKSYLSTGSLALGGFHDVKFANGGVTNGRRGRVLPYSSSTQPSTGTWSPPDFVYNSAPSVDGNNMILLGWVCTSGGNPGIWQPCYVSNQSNAAAR